MKSRWNRLVFAGATLAFLHGCASASRPPRPVAPVPAPPPPTLRNTLQPVMDSILADPVFAPASIGVLVLDATTLDTLYAHNAHKALMPASNMKIVTSSVAMARLGPDYRYRTTFVPRGAVRDSTLEGDLLVIGRGDPSISQRMRGNPLDALGLIADSLRARGISRVRGSLIRAGDAFPGSIYGFGWEYDDFSNDYGAGVDELMFNEGLAFEPDSPTGGDTTSTPPAVSPADAYMEALRAALIRRRVRVDGTIARDSTYVPSPNAAAFVVQSPPLSEILSAVLKPSQNQIAEVVFRTLALEATGSGNPDSAARIVTDQLRAWGADTLEFLVHDGSGLSRHDLMSPATIARILLTMRDRPDFNRFYYALAAMGSEGTIRNFLKATRAAQVVRAKTGTLHLVRALSGYAASLDGHPIVFSFIANHFRPPTERVNVAIRGMVRTITELPLGP